MTIGSHPARQRAGSRAGSPVCRGRADRDGRHDLPRARDHRHVLRRRIGKAAERRPGPHLRHRTADGLRRLDRGRPTRSAPSRPTARGRSVGSAVTSTPREVVATGAQGKPGAGAPTGATGASPATDAPGAPGASGPSALASSKAPRSPGAHRSPKPTKPSSIANLLSTGQRAMIRVDARRIVVPTKGRRVGRVEIRVFCRRVAGNLEIRTAAKINPASPGQPAQAEAARHLGHRRLPARRRQGGLRDPGLDTQARGLLRRLGAPRSTVVISVIDANSRRQHIRAEVTVVARKR